MDLLERPKARTDLTVVELDGEAVIYDEITADIHHLNPTATVVFSLLDGTVTIDELAGEVSAAYGMPPHRVRDEIAELVRSLAGSRLLVGFEPDPDAVSDAEEEPSSAG